MMHENLKNFMMTIRERKYKAWDIEAKRMFTVSSWSHPYYLNSLIEATGQSSDSVIAHCSDDCILMEYIGFQSRDEKDIYEGDICKFSDWKPKVIVWRDGRYWLGDTLVICCIMECKKMSIISNICKNPELLDKE